MMKIQDVKIRRVSMPRRDPQWATARYSATQGGYEAIQGFVLTAVADGIEGIGATAAHLWQITGDDLQQQLEGPLREVLEGADALNANEMHQRISSLNLSPRARLGADLLVQDLVGKKLGLPCHALWGGAIK